MKPKEIIVTTQAEIECFFIREKEGKVNVYVE